MNHTPTRARTRVAALVRRWASNRCRRCVDAATSHALMTQRTHTRTFATTTVRLQRWAGYRIEAGGSGTGQYPMLSFILVA